PGKGTPKADLCVETLECVLSTGCTNCDRQDIRCPCAPITKFGQCYCLLNDPGVFAFPQACYDPTPDIEGPCKDKLDRSLETTHGSTVLASYGDPSKAGSWAMLLMQCLVDNKCQSCFSQPAAGSDAAPHTKPHHDAAGM